MDMSVNGGRLTAHATDPFGEESTGVDVLRLLPCNGNLIAIYNSSLGKWAYVEIGSNFSFNVSTDNDVVGNAIAVDSNYDVYALMSSGFTVPKIWLEKWTNDTTRATALVRQDGVLVRSGDEGARYLGTVRTVDVGSAPKIVDHDRRRYVWNASNRVTRRNQTGVSSPTTYDTVAAAIQTLNNADYDGYHHSFVVGIEAQFSARMNVSTYQLAATSQIQHFIYLDGAGAAAGEDTRAYQASAGYSNGAAFRAESVGIGLHAWKAYEDPDGVFTVLLNFMAFLSEGEW